jgi:hypothetical protein
MCLTLQGTVVAYVTDKEMNIQQLHGTLLTP